MVIIVTDAFYCHYNEPAILYLSAAGQAQQHLKLAHPGHAFSYSLHPLSPSLPIFSKDLLSAHHNTPVVHATLLHIYNTL